MTATLPIGGLAIRVEVQPDGRRLIPRDEDDRLKAHLDAHDRHKDGMRQTVGGGA